MATNGDITTLPPGLSTAPEISEAPRVVFDSRSFDSPVAAYKRLVTGADLCRILSTAPASLCAGATTAVATKALLTACLVPAVVVGHIIPLACVAASLPAAALLSFGPIRRFARSRVRQWYSSFGGGLVDSEYTDPGFGVRDAAEDEEDDAPAPGTLPLDDAGRPVRRKRKRHFAPYSGGKVRGAYLAAVVAQVRSLYAGRARDSAAEHGARRALVTRMKEHGVRDTDIDRVREHMLNAVFYVSEDEEVAASVQMLGAALGLQRGPGSRA